MSLQTWKEEFYPVPAETVQQDDALAHAVQKWQGMKLENLAKHGVAFDAWGDVTDARDDPTADETHFFKANSETCALCQHYHGFSNADENESHCPTCPLAIARGGVSCDSTMDEEDTSPWHDFLYDGKPSNMIYWLEKATESK